MQADLIFVHGLWLTGRESLVLRRRLEREFGYRVHTFRYPSVVASMSDITARLASFARRIDAWRLHFVGHSLGGLVIQRLLEGNPDLPSGRVVFLGTPAVASRVASEVSRLRFGTAFVGRCLAEELLPPRERRWKVARELGVIAGTRPLGLGWLIAHFEEPNDGTVAVSETRLSGATDHLTLPVSHLGMLLSAKVAREVGKFLEKGRFSLS